MGDRDDDRVLGRVRVLATELSRRMLAGARRRVHEARAPIDLSPTCRTSRSVLDRLADVASILTRRVFGFNANRRTEETVTATGLVVEDVRRDGIWREIVARPPLSDPVAARPAVGR